MRDETRVSSPVFVVGTPRSGTTLVGNIFGNHPHIFVPRAETHYFQDIYARRSEIGDLTSVVALNKALERLLTLYGRFNYRQAQEQISRPGFRDDLVARFTKTGKTYGELLDCFMTLQAEALGKLRWGDNTPQDIFNVVDICRFFPDCRIIVCVRDVRDFLISYKYQWRMSRTENVDRVKSLYHPVVTALLWRANIEQIRQVERVAPAGQWMLVRYEDLVQQPEEEVRKICSLIGEEFHPAMLLVGSSNSSFEARKAGIFTGSVGRWKQDHNIAPEEIYVAELITKPQMQRLGYHLSGTKADWFRIVALFCSLPFAAVRAVYKNKERINKGKVRILLPYLLRKILPILHNRSFQYKLGQKVSQRVNEERIAP